MAAAARRGRLIDRLRVVGPGLAIAATGVGAGDLLAAMVAGAEFGATLGWVIVVGAALKLALNEGVARWQLATDTTLLEGWCRHLGRWFQLVFLGYLVVWSFWVAGGLMSACGVAANALVPGVGVAAFAAVHSLFAAAVVLLGRYEVFENVMKVLIALMVITLLAAVGMVGPDIGAALRGLLLPRLPGGSAGVTLGLMGGVGGSVTLLAYGYWVRERGWRGLGRLSDVRWDLAVGYVLTGLFGLAMLLLAATVLGGTGGGMPPGSVGLVACGEAIDVAATERFGSTAGGAARLVFLVGVWGAVLTSTLGVWNGVPYLFADFVLALRGRFGEIIDTRGVPYRAALLFLAGPPMVLLSLDRPIWVIRAYTIVSGLFMPLLAASLLWMLAQRRLVGRGRSRGLATALLVAALALFVIIAVRQIIDL